MNILEQIFRLKILTAAGMFLATMCYPHCSVGWARQNKTAPLPIKITDGTQATNIPIQLDPIHIFVETKINGKGPYTFALDTGASFTAIDSRVSKELNLDLKGNFNASGSGANVRKAQMANGVNIELPGVSLGNQTIVSLSLEDFESRLGHKLDGIIGFDFFNNFVVEIDYEASVLRVFKQENFSYRGNGHIIPITLKGRRPQMQAVVAFPGRDPIESNFIIDTGAGSQVRFNSPFVQQHDLTTAIPTKLDVISGYGIGGESTSTMGRIDSVKLGGLVFENPVINLSLAKKGGGANKAAAGIIGGGLFERCSVIFDYKRNQMILTPNKRFSTPFEFDMLGISWKTGGRDKFQDINVVRVRQNSAADEAGILAGDRLLAFNGLASERLTLAYLKLSAKTNGKTVRLKIQRKEKIVVFEIELKRIL